MKTMSNELFSILIKEDYWIERIALATEYRDKYFHFLYYVTCSYPDKYIVTEEQIAKAKKMYSIRKSEILQGIKKGELVFCAMGCNFNSNNVDGIGNYRIRCYFKNLDGHKYFIELSCHSENNSTFYVEYSIDEILREKRDEERRCEFEYRRSVNGHWNIVDKQDYYNCFGVENTWISKPYSYKHVVEFINKIYGCSYKTSRLISNYASCEEWCCYC